MEILLWLTPPLVVTLAAMAWVSWVGRDSTREVDPDVAAARMERALSRRTPVRYAPRRPPVAERGHGVALRASRPEPQLEHPASPSAGEQDAVRLVAPADASPDQGDDERARRAS
ncbi:MAG: hypothetical protein U0R80_05240 [Nocardioidaceae bacterium]